MAPPCAQYTMHNAHEVRALAQAATQRLHTHTHTRTQPQHVQARSKPHEVECLRTMPLLLLFLQWYESHPPHSCSAQPLVSPSGERHNTNTGVEQQLVTTNTQRAGQGGSIT